LIQFKIYHHFFSPDIHWRKGQKFRLGINSITLPGEESPGNRSEQPLQPGSKI